jgi:hypothetical protein
MSNEYNIRTYYEEKYCLITTGILKKDFLYEFDVETPSDQFLDLVKIDSVSKKFLYIDEYIRHYENVLKKYTVAANKKLPGDITRQIAGYLKGYW